MIIGCSISNYSDEQIPQVREFAHLISGYPLHIISALIKRGSFNVPTISISLKDLQKQSFSCTPIYEREGMLFVISSTLSTIEIQLNGRLYRLQPSDYFFTPLLGSDVLHDLYEQGFIKVAPDNFNNQVYIENNLWNDDGKWHDTTSWEETK